VSDSRNPGYKIRELINGYDPLTVTKKVEEIYGIPSSQASESHGAEVQQISNQLQEHAIRMLLDYLRKTRQSRRKTAAAATNSNTGKNAAKEHLIDQVRTQESLISSRLIPLYRPSIHVYAKF
jgi:hypothetical protein